MLPQLPATVDPKTITMSNSPTGGDAKRLADIANFKVGQIGLKYVGFCRRPCITGAPGAAHPTPIPPCC